MSLLGSLAKHATSLAGPATSLIGGIASASALNKGYREQQDMFNNRLADVKAHRDAVYYQDPTQSAENQAAVTQAQAALDAANKRAAATSAVTGGTDESAALAKAAAQNSVADMLQYQAASAQGRKDAAWQSADNQIDTFSKYLADSKLAQAQGKAKAISDATKQLVEAENQF